MTKKEIEAKEHLEEMSEITRHIGYNDIQMFSKKSKTGITQKMQDREIQD